eukprot:s314_g31.t2
MMGGYFQDFEKVRTRRRYVACTGCSSSWIWADRINAQRWDVTHVALHGLVLTVTGREVKEAVVGLIKRAPSATIDVTEQLKATVGELRQLATKKQSLPRKVDMAKDHYKLLLEELKGVQEAIDKEHKQLGDQSEAYAKQLKEEAVPFSPPNEHVLDTDATEHVLKALGQAGILFNSASERNWSAIWLKPWPSAARLVKPS